MANFTQTTCFRAFRIFFKTRSLDISSGSFYLFFGAPCVTEVVRVYDGYEMTHTLWNVTWHSRDVGDIRYIIS